MSRSSRYKPKRGWPVLPIIAYATSHAMRKRGAGALAETPRPRSRTGFPTDNLRAALAWWPLRQARFGEPAHVAGLDRGQCLLVESWDRGGGNEGHAGGVLKFVLASSEGAFHLAVTLFSSVLIARLDSVYSTQKLYISTMSAQQQPQMANGQYDPNGHQQYYPPQPQPQPAPVAVDVSQTHTCCR
jgi:hypothetical protein